MPIESTEVLPGEGWYAVAKRLGGSQASQAVKDRNAGYLAAANGSKDVSGPLYPHQIIWYNPARIVGAPAPTPTPERVRVVEYSAATVNTPRPNAELVVWVNVTDTAQPANHKRPDVVYARRY